MTPKEFIAIRKQWKMSQKELSYAISIGSSYISRIENKSVPVSEKATNEMLELTQEIVDKAKEEAAKKLYFSPTSSYFDLMTPEFEKLWNNISRVLFLNRKLKNIQL